MNVTYFKYALEVEKTASITQAANNLYMGQPNLTKAIKKLEASVGFAIFKRTQHGVYPTKKGAEFLSYARNIISLIDEMEALYSQNNANMVNFNICVPRASYITYTFSKFINELVKKKELNVDFRETGSTEIINNVASGEYNLGIIRYSNRHEKYFKSIMADKSLQRKQLWEFEYLVLMSEENPLAKSKEIRLEDLELFTEITHGDFSVPSVNHTQLYKNDAQPKNQSRIYIYERGSQFDLLNGVPTTYMWVSPLPAEILKEHKLVQRRCVNIGDMCKDILIHRTDYKLSKTEKSFFDCLNQTIEELSAETYI